MKIRSETRLYEIRNLKRGQIDPVPPFKISHNKPRRFRQKASSHRKSEGLRSLLNKVSQSGKMSIWIELRK